MPADKIRTVIFKGKPFDEYYTKHGVKAEVKVSWSLDVEDQIRRILKSHKIDLDNNQLTEFMSRIGVARIFNDIFNNAFDEPLKKDARKQIENLKSALDALSLNLKLKLIIGKNNPNNLYKQLIKLSDSFENRNGTRTPTHHTLSKVLQVSVIGQAFEKITGKKPTATVDGAFDQIVRVFFQEIDDSYLGNDQRKLIKKGLSSEARKTVLSCMKDDSRFPRI